jgi:hypothetical protein
MRGPLSGNASYCSTNVASTGPLVLVAADVETDSAVVLAPMAERRLGSTVVVGPFGVEGVFTASDAMRALIDVLDREAT